MDVCSVFDQQSSNLTMSVTGCHEEWDTSMAIDLVDRSSCIYQEGSE